MQLGRCFNCLSIPLLRNSGIAKSLHNFVYMQPSRLINWSGVITLRSARILLPKLRKPVLACFNRSIKFKKSHGVRTESSHQSCLNGNFAVIWLHSRIIISMGVLGISLVNCHWLKSIYGFIMVGRSPPRKYHYRIMTRIEKNTPSACDWAP